MNILFKSSVLCASVLLAACNNDDHQQSQTTPENNTPSKYYQTKTPYQPLQDLKNMSQLHKDLNQFLLN